MPGGLGDLILRGKIREGWRGPALPVAAGDRGGPKGPPAGPGGPPKRETLSLQSSKSKSNLYYGVELHMSVEFEILILVT